MEFLSLFEGLLDVFKSESFKQVADVVIKIITIVASVLAFYNSRAAKRELLRDKKQRTRKGEVQLSVTHRVGNGMFRLAQLAIFRTNSLFSNEKREQEFRNADNEDRTALVSSDNGAENVGLLQMETSGENKFVSLTFSELYERMWAQQSLWHAAGVPCREVSFLHAVRQDTYATKDKVDGYQMTRSILALKDEVEEAGTTPDFLSDNGTEISYQRDRLHQMQEIYRVWKSGTEDDKWRVVELKMPVPEIFFSGLEIQKLQAAIVDIQDTISALKQMGGELSESRLNELAAKSANETMQALRRAIG